MKLPPDINKIFIDTISGELPVLEFEQWLYNNKQLETILSAEDYLDLISYGYKSNDSKPGLLRLLKKHIDIGELETQRIHKLLTQALKRDRDLPKILACFYDLYCKGYYFFDALGLVYGLKMEVPGINNYEETWEDLDETQLNVLLNSFYPNLEIEIKKVISWLDNGEIILTGIADQYNHFEYIDNRPESERLPWDYGIESDLSNVNPEKPPSDKSPKPWWKFW